MFSAPKLHRIVYYFMLPMFWLLKEYVVWGGRGSFSLLRIQWTLSLHWAPLLLVFTHLRSFFPPPYLWPSLMYLSFTWTFECRFDSWSYFNGHYLQAVAYFFVIVDFSTRSVVWPSLAASYLFPCGCGFFLREPCCGFGILATSYLSF